MSDKIAYIEERLQQYLVPYQLTSEKDSKHQFKKIPRLSRGILLFFYCIAALTVSRSASDSLG